jgi:endo-1,4-beta-xylanase
MHKKMLTRRDFIKLAGVTSAGLAISACGVQATELPVPTNTSVPIAKATLTPSSTPRPQVSVLAPGKIYSGPRNVGYETVAALSENDQVMPVATFGEYAKLEANIGDRWYGGFVEKSVLGTLPSDLPELPVSEVPWLQKTVVPSTLSISIAPESPDYQGTSLYGSTLIPDSEFQVRIELSLDFGERSPADISSGIWLHDEITQSRIILGYEKTNGWGICYYQGETFVFCESLLLPKERSHKKFILSLSQNNSVLAISLPNGATKHFDLGGPAFAPSDTLKIYTQVGSFGTLDIHSLSIAQVPDGLPETNPALLESLGQLAEKHGMTFGTESDDGDISHIGELVVTAQANLLVWSINWHLATEVEGFDNFKLPPSRLSFAEAHNMRVRAHPLIGGPYDIVPGWIKSLSNQELENATRKWIQSMVSTFTSVDEWVVVNEALGGEAALDNNIWHRRFGKQYIDTAFRFAREANPNAVLLFNEAEVDRPNARTMFVYDLLRELLDQGTPMDGVGLQFHLKAVNAPTKDEMIETFQRFGGLGLSVYITELDVNLFGLQGSKEDKWNRQAEIYRAVTEAALESGVCRSITTWGLSDKYSWLLAPEFQFLGGGEAPLLFDDDYNPKPAYFAVRDVLSR